MKICPKHENEVRRGMTYEPSTAEECEICKLIKDFLDEHQRIYGF